MVENTEGKTEANLLNFIKFIKPLVFVSYISLVTFSFPVCSKAILYSFNVNYKYVGTEYFFFKYYVDTEKNLTLACKETVQYTSQSIFPWHIFFFLDIFMTLC